jgi:D-tyrosyl-tRNA(Tyr) deacylase
MRSVIQRVSSASVISDGQLTGQIEHGLLVLLGIEHDDTKEDAQWLADKVIQMRLFPDDEQKINLSLQDIKGEILLVSQFTLHANTKKGNRPSFIRAAKPETAIPLYEYFKDYLSIKMAHKIPSGIFGAEMKVSLVNDGPVTIIIDSKQKEL